MTVYTEPLLKSASREKFLFADKSGINGQDTFSDTNVNAHRASMSVLACRCFLNESLMVWEYTVPDSGKLRPVSCRLR